jgi:hypothetical protein
METLMSTVADPTVARAREAVLGALRAQGLDVEAEVSVRGLAASADEVLEHAPWLQILGEERVP